MLSDLDPQLTFLETNCSASHPLKTTGCTSTSKRAGSKQACRGEQARDPVLAGRAREAEQGQGYIEQAAQLRAAARGGAVAQCGAVAASARRAGASPYEPS